MQTQSIIARELRATRAESPEDLTEMPDEITNLDNAYKLPLVNLLSSDESKVNSGQIGHLLKNVLFASAIGSDSQYMIEIKPEQYEIIKEEISVINKKSEQVQPFGIVDTVLFLCYLHLKEDYSDQSNIMARSLLIFSLLFKLVLLGESNGETKYVTTITDKNIRIIDRSNISFEITSTEYIHIMEAIANLQELKLTESEQDIAKETAEISEDIVNLVRLTDIGDRSRQIDNEYQQFLEEASGEMGELLKLTGDRYRGASKSQQEYFFELFNEAEYAHILDLIKNNFEPVVAERSIAEIALRYNQLQETDIIIKELVFQIPGPLCEIVALENSIAYRQELLQQGHIFFSTYIALHRSQAQDAFMQISYSQPWTEFSLFKLIYSYTNDFHYNRHLHMTNRQLAQFAAEILDIFSKKMFPTSYENSVTQLEDKILKLLANMEQVQVDDVTDSVRWCRLIRYEFLSNQRFILECTTGLSTVSQISKDNAITDMRLINCLLLIDMLNEICLVDSGQEYTLRISRITMLALFTGKINAVRFVNMTEGSRLITPMIDPILNLEVFAALQFQVSEIMQQFGKLEFFEYRNSAFVIVAFCLIKYRNISIQDETLIKKYDGQNDEYVENYEQLKRGSVLKSFFSSYMKYLLRCGFKDSTALAIEELEKDVETEMSVFRRRYDELNEIVFTNVLPTYIETPWASREGYIGMEQQLRLDHGEKYQHYIRAKNNLVANPVIFCGTVLEQLENQNEELTKAVDSLKEMLPFTHQQLDVLSTFFSGRAQRTLVETYQTMFQNIVENLKDQTNIRAILPDWIVTDVYGFHAVISANPGVAELMAPEKHQSYGLKQRPVKEIRMTVDQNKETMFDGRLENYNKYLNAAIDGNDMQVLNAFMPHNAVFSQVIFEKLDNLGQLMLQDRFNVTDPNFMEQQYGERSAALKNMFPYEPTYMTISNLIDAKNMCLLYGPINETLCLCYFKQVEFFVPNLDETAIVYNLESIGNTVLTEDEFINPQYTMGGELVYLKDPNRKIQLAAQKESIEEQMTILAENCSQIFLSTNEAISQFVSASASKQTSRMEQMFINNTSAINYVRNKIGFMESMLIISKHFPGLFEIVMRERLFDIDRYSRKETSQSLLRQYDDKYQDNQIQMAQSLNNRKIIEEIKSIVQQGDVEIRQTNTQNLLQQQSTGQQNLKIDLKYIMEQRRLAENVNVKFMYLTSYQTTQLYRLLASLYTYHMKTVLIDVSLGQVTIDRLFLQTGYMAFYHQEVELLVKTKIINYYNSAYALVSGLQYKLVNDDLATFARINFKNSDDEKSSDFVVLPNYIKDYVASQLAVQQQQQVYEKLAQRKDALVKELLTEQKEYYELLLQQQQLTAAFFGSDEINAQGSRTLSEQLTTLNSNLQKIRDRISEKEEQIMDINIDLGVQYHRASVFSSGIRQALKEDLLLRGSRTQPIEKSVGTLNNQIRNAITAYKTSMSRVIADINTRNRNINPQNLQEFNTESQNLRSLADQVISTIKSYFQDENTQKEKLLDRVIYEKADVKQFLYTFAFAKLEESDNQKATTLLDENEFTDNKKVLRAAQKEALFYGMKDLRHFTNTYMYIKFQDEEDPIVSAIIQASPSNIHNRIRGSIFVDNFIRDSQDLPLIDPPEITDEEARRIIRDNATNFADVPDNQRFIPNRIIRPSVPDQQQERLVTRFEKLEADLTLIARTLGGSEDQADLLIANQELDEKLNGFYTEDGSRDWELETRYSRYLTGLELNAEFRGSRTDRAIIEMRQNYLRHMFLYNKIEQKQYEYADMPDKNIFLSLISLRTKILAGFIILISRNEGKNEQFIETVLKTPLNINIIPYLR